MKSIIYFLLLHILYVNCQNTYTAAVVEYYPKPLVDTPQNLLLENVQEYQKYIENAAEKEAQIIVFPEDGLTGIQLISNRTLEELSTEIPNANENISPCMNSSNVYSKALIDLSCAAKTYRIYVVVNLIEKRNASQNVTNYYNTNIVFDRAGTVIAKHRKVNLFNEEIFTEGIGPTTFKTDFGVNFGMFICFDLMFKNPALDVLNDSSVTDVVYSTAWFSQLPFLEALSIQHGYAKTNGINFLVAGLNDPKNKNGGSGIYLANGQIADSYIVSAASSKLIIQNVTRITRRTPDESCQSSVTPSPRLFGLGIGGIMPDISTFVTATEDMKNYTFKSLNLNVSKISETVCSSSYCCSFEITLNRNQTVRPNYSYKLVAFYGSRLTSLTKTIGVRNCGVVACLNDSNESCGQRHTLPPSGITFERISINGTFSTLNSYDQPATLKSDLKTITDYTYCRDIRNSSVTINMTTTGPVDSLLTFGLYGRVFKNDNKPAGRMSPNSAFSFNANMYTVFVISFLLFLLQD